MADELDLDLTVKQTPQEVAAEEADFAAAFHSERGTSAEEPAAVVEEEQAPAPAAEPAPAAAATTDPKAVLTADTKPVLAGLTEEQVAAALARSSQQQATIDKLGGRIGHLIQQIEQLKSVSRTDADRRSLNVKLTRLSEAFPELAELLQEDLKGIGSGEPAALAAAAPSFTAEDVDRIVTEKLTSFQQQQERGMEVRALGSVHPDWEQVIRTPQFALWRDNVIQDGQALMESESAQFISRKLTEFKDWVKATTVAPAQAAAAPAPRQSAQQRLRAAVLPTTPTPPPTGAVSEEDAFAAGFAAERNKTGY